MGEQGIGLLGNTRYMERSERNDWDQSWKLFERERSVHLVSGLTSSVGRLNGISIPFLEIRLPVGPGPT